MDGNSTSLKVLHTRLPIKSRNKKIISFEACWATQWPKYVLSQVVHKLVIVVGHGPTKPFEICEGNHDEWHSPFDLHHHSRF
jgi:hypothetical protein